MANKPEYFIGIDVSKNDLSVCIIFENTTHNFTIKNEKLKILKFFAMYANLNSFCVFENTNTYCYDIMRAFDELGLAYSKLDPLKFSFFMKNQRKIKTDKSDAYLLAIYAKKFYDELIKSEFSEEYALLKSYQSGLALINKMLSQTKNFKEPLINVNNNSLEESFDEIIASLIEQKKVLEEKVFDLVCELVPETKKILNKNKGISKSFAIYVLPLFWMNKDKTTKQITSFLGLVPNVHQSGTSINKCPHISGGVKLARNTLYMCALTISKYNKDFAPLYQKHLNRGKPKKVALIALARVFARNIFRKYFKDDR
ncbi:MAG: transposase [Campylobacter sp.]|uniref:transposase n=1 Tax=Campylobacter sp. TaxID=205 RepID=UPI002A395200|nr:transposase [Campylobacter sp.]MDD6925150.1 transposase [Campylobacteraceae bacterium]MCI6178478.1 transposase [Campylobacter sp.]MDD7091239.1 transposase [Campylobacteraceae bacterium]MDY3245707.1 transposase [Campylobacter sp.]MDY5284868.1 transposase [Campylobacter sp.]